MSASFSAVNSGIHKAVIPAAGLGTRLRPLTFAFPKELLPVGRKPVLAHIAAELRAAGITHALFIVSERKPQIRAFFGDVYQEEGDTLPPLHCEYVLQLEQHGLGDALLYSEQWVGADPFVVAFGDCLVESIEPAAPLRRLIATHQAQRAGATVLAETVAWEKVSRYGVLAPEMPHTEPPTEPFALADIVEKPAREAAPSNFVVAARYAFQPALFDALRRAPLDVRGELNVTDPVRLLRQDGLPLWAVPLRSGEFRRDIGNFETFYAAFLRAALRDPDYGEMARRVAEEELRNSASPPNPLITKEGKA